MKGATIVAFAATVGNLLQGWDSGAIAGALLYLKPEFGLVDNPLLEGIVVASTLVGAWMSTLFAGPGADWIGRRWMLCISGIIFSASASIMFWSPNIHVLIFSRLLVGSAMGLAATIIPIYIAETSPPEIRGQLATFPQLMGSGGLFLGYITVYMFSLANDPNWRYMLGCLLIPSIIFLSLTLLYLPETPPWLVSKGRISDAKKVLQRLRKATDVRVELALLVEGLGVGARSSLEEWLIEPLLEPQLLEPADIIVEQNELPKDENQIEILKPDEGISGVARSFNDQIGMQGIPTGRDTAESIKVTLMDSVVTLSRSFSGTQENISQCNPESLQDGEDEHWDEETNQCAPLGHGDQFEYRLFIGEMDETLATPLLPEPMLIAPPYSRSNSQTKSPRTVLHIQDGLTNGRSLHDFLGNLSSTSSNSKSDQTASLRTRSMDLRRHTQSSSYFRHHSLPQGNMPVVCISDFATNVGIEGGWQLVWRWDAGTEGREAIGGVGSLKRGYSRQEQIEHTSPTWSDSSLSSLGGDIKIEATPAAALVRESAQHISLRDMLPERGTATKGSPWSDLLDGGVRRALIVGVGLQFFQQFMGINAVSYFIPQIIQQSRATILLQDVLGIGADSGSILASGITSLITLPCIVLAMRLMDVAGRRQLLLATLPVLLFSLISLSITNMFLPSGSLQAAASLSGLTLYLCTFMMGFGPIPNILCSEIYPPRVRGICISICQSTYWICELLVTNAFPSLLLSLGIGGIFGFFAAASLLAWIFVFLKVPETKGMSLAVISDFFDSMSAN